jgi:hypothetical protein
MNSSRPPLLPDECPPVSYTVTVRRTADFLTVDLTLLHQMPDGSVRQGFMSEGSQAVWEPCWLFRLLGDTTERRIERAKVRMARRAEREIAKRRRLDAVARAVA